MARVRELDQAGWDAWVATRPAKIQEMCRDFPPDRLYRLNGTGSRVLIYSYQEDGTFTVMVTAEYNACTFERRVFGIKPESLIECDPPGPDEPVGALFTEDAEIQACIEAMREAEFGGAPRE